MIQLTPHAQKRAAQRNFSYEDILFIVQYGSTHPVAGAVFCELYQKDLPQDIKPNEREADLVGSTVILCRYQRCVITVYKNPSAFKSNARKMPYSIRDNRCYCSIA
jgi:hypothetical protein